MKASNIILASIAAFSILSITVSNRAYAIENITNELDIDSMITEDNNINDVSIDIINNLIFNDSIIENENITSEDDALKQEMDMFKDALSNTVHKFEGTPNIGEHEPYWSYSIADNKIVDVIQVDNDIFAIWYVTNTTYRISADALLDFFYKNIYLTTGLDMGND